MRSRNVSSCMSVRATPITVNSSGSSLWWASLASAGISLRVVRSPDAPKITSTPGGAFFTVILVAPLASVTAAGSSPLIANPPPPLMYRNPPYTGHLCTSAASLLLRVGGRRPFRSGVVGGARGLPGRLGRFRLAQHAVAAELVAEGGDDAGRERL